MKKLVLLPLLCTLVGCSTDNASSLARDYRNLNNEYLDALMMVTNESSAKFAQDKVVKPYTDRKGKIDKRYETWELNTDDKEIVKDLLSSESVVMLFAEHRINRIRLQREKARVKKLLEFKIETEKERQRLAGVANPVVDSRKEWPNLSELAAGGVLNPLKDNIQSVNGCRLTALFDKFPDKSWDKARPPNFKELVAAFKEKEERFSRLEP